MPIEHMVPAMEAEETSESEAPEQESPEVEEVTATIDAGIVGGQEVSPGDMIKLEVVSVDPDMGSIVVRYPKGSGDEEGIHEMAAKFKREPKQSEEY